MGAEHCIYAKVDKHNAETIEFVGTMSELGKYTGTKEASIRSYISRCKKENRFCPYFQVEREPLTEEEKKMRSRQHSKRQRERIKLEILKEYMK